MSKLLRFLIVAPLLLVGCSEPGSAERKLVEQTFSEYKSAILDQNGQVAVRLVSKRTIGEYQKYVDWALSADRETLQSLSTVNKMQVLIIKHRIPAEHLRKMDGRSSFAYGVDNDWIGKDGTIKTEISTVQVADSKATAGLLIDGREVPNRFHFVKEGESWKFDLVQTIRDADLALKSQIDESGMSENDFLFRIVETISGTKVKENIWEPLH